jgi:hypothetical protein
MKKLATENETELALSALLVEALGLSTTTDDEPKVLSSLLNDYYYLCIFNYIISKN